MSEPRLDDAVHDALCSLEDSALDSPDVLLWLGTGAGTLGGSLRRSRRLELHTIEGVPEPWADAELHSGDFGGTRVWLLDDAPGELEFGGGNHGAPAWERAFPAWLAAQAGAHICVHTSAAMTLDVDDAPELGTLAVASDHVNLSGRTPLLGLGQSRLGPLFPDQSRLHHEGLRRLALERARAGGIPLSEVVAACILGPTLTTPAERRWLSTSGAHVAAQGLAEPLIGCAHAGMAVLELIAVIDDGEHPVLMPELVQRAERCAPALEDLIAALAGDLAEVAKALEEEQG
ncbi:MAG: purine-nucleoside phosphorylase [bacterium]|nr:purine-nucleoside phosphorylase [bacterium]